MLATQPLYVVAVRSMAQFVGGEAKYGGVLAPFKEILKENGIIGEREGGKGHTDLRRLGH